MRNWLMASAVVAMAIAGSAAVQAGPVKAAAAAAPGKSTDKAARRTAASSAQIPATFRGRWGVNNPCHLDADVQLHIEPTRITGYEDRVDIRSVRRNSAMRVTIQGDMEIAGEAGRHPVTILLELRQNGTRLRATYSDTPELPQDYVRCTAFRQD